MTISDFSVHNVLRTYSKQYRIGKLVSGSAKSSSSESKGDVIEISNEVKRIAFTKNVADEIFTELKGKVSKEEINKKVTQELKPFINELVEEFSPEDKDIIAIIKDKMLELF